MTREEMEIRADELAQEHWNYIFELLKAHNIHKDHMEIASFHYYEAFKHGYKHCWEDRESLYDTYEAQSSIYNQECKSRGL